MANKTKQKTSLSQYLWILTLLALLFLVGTTGYYILRYQERYLPGTEIMGVDCSSLTPAEAADALDEAARSAELPLGDSSGAMIAQVPLSVFYDSEVLAGTAERIFAEQMENTGVFDWLLTAEHVYHPAPLAAIERQEVTRRLNDYLYGQSPRVNPENARVEITDTGYRVEAEEAGNAVNMRVCTEALLPALRQLDTLTGQIPAVIAEGALLTPAVTAESDSVEQITRALDDYLDLSVVLDFGGGTEYTLSPEDVRGISDVRLNGREVSAHPVPELVRAFTDDLADRYAYDGVYAKFLHAQDTRNYVYYRVGDTGWKLDREELARQVCQALETEEPAVITPVYDCTWYWKDYYHRARVGDTYIEISLDNQYLWAFKDGQLLVETPVVTGNISRRDYTNRGCFRIAYKETDLNLRGPTWDDHVDYWMPFDGEIGLHDSSWRSEYGGDIYLTDGSHGCVNTPLDAMRIIYENFNEDDIVIVY